MKPIYLKIILTIVVLLLGYLIIEFIFDRDLILSDGHIELEIIDEQGTTVFNEIIPYQEDQTFFDVLNESFELTCANRSYQPDPTCSYEFKLFSQTHHIILGIKTDSFDIMTDWDHTFLNIEIYDGTKYVDSTIGVDGINLNEINKIRILVDEVGS